MALKVRDVIEIPETKPKPFVVVSEINDDELKAYHSREYVITDTVAEGLRAVITNVSESADKGFAGCGVWVAGSFGVGKSHFMSFAGMLLRGERVAWQREIPELSKKDAKSLREKLQKHAVFVVPFNTLRRPDDIRLGAYQALDEELVRQGLPVVELTSFAKVIDYFERLAESTPAFWETLFEKSTIIASREEYEEQKKENQELLAKEITEHFAPPAEWTSGALAVDMAEGIRRMTGRLKEHGFKCLVFLIDELTLFLQHTSDPGRAAVELKVLLEAEGASLPVWGLVVRHAPLEDVMRDVGKDILDNLKGRFLPRVIDIQDVDLYEVLGKRVLKPAGRTKKQRSESKKAIRDAVEASFGQIPLEQRELLDELYGKKRFAQAVRSLYPFHPAIVDTLVSITHRLSRERTAISVMYDMLFDMADQELGTLTPYHLVFDYLLPESSHEIKEVPVLEAARRIMTEKVTPLLENEYLGNAEKIRRGKVVARSIILGELTDKGVDLRGRMTPAVIGALNASVLNSKVSILTKKQLNEVVDLLCNRLLGTFKRDGDAVTVELTLGLDPMEELRKLAPPDLTNWRRRVVLELLNALLGTDKEQGKTSLNVKWRGTKRKGTVQIVETTTTVLPPPDKRSEFAIWVTFPLFAGDTHQVTAPLGGAPGAIWFPRESSGEVREQLNNLAKIAYLDSKEGKAKLYERYSGDEAKALLEGWQGAAFSLADRVRSELQSAYTLGQVRSSLNIGESLARVQDLQSVARDLAARLLDARWRQHPEFTADVTSPALETLFRALVKGNGELDAEPWEVSRYAADYGLPLRIVKMVGTGYIIDLGNSSYIQGMEDKLGREGATLEELQQGLRGDFGLQPYVSDFLARLTIVFRDLRVMRGNAALAVEDPAELSLRSSDILLQGQRVNQGEWAAFGEWLEALGAPIELSELSVRNQDSAWNKLVVFHDQERRSYEQMRKATVQAVSSVGGAPRDLENAIKMAKEVLDALGSAVRERSSEAGIRTLLKEKRSREALPELLKRAEAMTKRLDDTELRDLYKRVEGVEDIAVAREIITEYAVGKVDQSDAVQRLKNLLRPRPKLRATLRATLGPLRKALTKMGAQPEEGWGDLDRLDDNTEVNVEIWHDTES